LSGDVAYSVSLSWNLQAEENISTEFANISFILEFISFGAEIFSVIFEDYTELKYDLWHKKRNYSSTFITQESSSKGRCF